MPELPYFVSRNGFHYYRRVVPPELRDIIGKREIKRRLGSDQTEALAAYVKVHKNAEQALRDARRLSPAPTGDREAVIRRMKQSGLFSAADIALIARGNVEAGSDLGELTSIFQDTLIEEYEAAERRGADPKVSLEAIRAVGQRRLPKQVHTLASALDDYFADRSTGVHARDLALSNRVNYIKQQLITVLGKSEVTKRPLEDLSREEARKVRDYLASRMSPASVKRNLEIVSPAINTLIKEHGLKAQNQFAGLAIKGAANTRGRRLPLTAEDMKALAPVMETEDALGAIWITLRDTGARLGEVCNLRVMDVDVDSSAIMIRPYGDHTLKTKNSERPVPLSPAALEALLRFTKGQPSDAVLFPSYAGPRRAEKASAALMKRMRNVVTDPKKTVHSLRHRMKDLLRMECPETLAQEIMGHCDQYTAYNYGAGPALEMKRAALMKVWA